MLLDGLQLPAFNLSEPSIPLPRYMFGAFDAVTDCRPVPAIPVQATAEHWAAYEIMLLLLCCHYDPTTSEPVPIPRSRTNPSNRVLACGPSTDPNTVCPSPTRNYPKPSTQGLLSIYNGESPDPLRTVRFAVAEVTVKLDTGFHSRLPRSPHRFASERSPKPLLTDSYPTFHQSDRSKPRLTPDRLVCLLSASTFFVRGSYGTHV